MPPSALERFAHRATALAERWMPDAFVFALAATLIVLAAALVVDPAMRAAPLDLVAAWGGGFWSLIPFTLQMTMIIVTGYVLATAPPVFRAIRALAAHRGESGWGAGALLREHEARLRTAERTRTGGGAASDP